MIYLVYTNRTLRKTTLALASLAIPLSFSAAFFRSPSHHSPVISIAAAGKSSNIAVAVDPAGTAYIAWANQTSPSSVIEYCVIPQRAKGCMATGVINTNGGGQGEDEIIDHVQLIVAKGSVRLFAYDYGPPVQEFIPALEWSSADDGVFVTFSAVSFGQSIANGNLGTNMLPLNAILMPSNNGFGFPWESAGNQPTFDAIPFSNPPNCSIVYCKAGYASLQPANSPNLIGAAQASFASETSPSPGVLGVFSTDGPPGPAISSCGGYNGTAFIYGQGTDNTAYNISSGSPGSAWGAVTAGDCGVENPVAVGGKAGLGVFEYDVSLNSIVWHPFDALHQDFDTPMVPIAKGFEEQASVSEDGNDGIYATYVSGQTGHIETVYSTNGGRSWSGPVTQTPQGVSLLDSAVGSQGQGWDTWVKNGIVYAQETSAFLSFPSQTATVKHNTIRLLADCAGTSCLVHLTITTNQGTKIPGAGSEALIIASGYRIIKPGYHSITLSLNAAGRRLLKNTSATIPATINAHYLTSGKASHTVTAAISIQG